MPIRIYALAKDLKIDSKELVDVCAKAGVTGKGSALASLTDDELATVKAYLQGGKKSDAPTAPAAPASEAAPSAPSQKGFTRDDYIAPGGGNTGKPRVIRPTSKPTPPPAAPEPPEETPEEPAEEPAVETPEEPPIEAPVEPVAEPPLELEPEVAETPPAPKSRKASPSKPPAKKGPVVRMAAIPKAPQPTPQKKSNEPAPQKPIMTLPADAIRNAKSGSRAPLEQFTKQQDKETAGGPPAGDNRKAAAGDRDATAKTGGRKRGKFAPAEAGGEEEGRDKKLANMAGSRAARQQKRRRTQVGSDDEYRESRPRRKRLVRKGTNTAAPRKGKVSVELPCTVRSLSEATGEPTASIQRALMGMGTMVMINQEIDPEMAEFVAEELNLEVEFKQAASLEDKLLMQIESAEDDPDQLVTRAPVITFLGHVDHGKTSLLDSIIGIDVVSGEAGGITQHIRAYKLTKDGREIAFVDTPGHEAFTEMRARGANVTDIAVLVIAADDGIMPQTEEAISHAKAAEVPIVVALNKCDLPGADINRAMQQLSAHDLLPAEWGGEVEVVQTSAINGTGIDDLLETLLLTADLHEYQANPQRAAVGTCLEAEQQGNRGVVAKMIVQNGTLRVGDVLICGGAFGKVKAMYDTLRPTRKLKEAGPSTPVNLTGLDIAPEAGDSFYVLDSIAQARQIAEHRQTNTRSQSLSGRTVRVSFEEFQRRLEEGRLGDQVEVSVLNLILRADVRGSIEAIQKELDKLKHPEVQIKLLQASVGGVTSADVTLAAASDAVIVGFNVIPDESARALADERGVEIRRYDIIYKVTEDLKAMLEGKLKPEERVAELGRALVQQTFTISRIGTVAGCRVLAGTIERGCRVRVNRNGRGIGDYPLDSLRREKDDTKEVREGYECGMKLVGFNDLKEGDILEAYKIEEVARSL